MKTCAICSKKLNIFNIRAGVRLKTGEQICLACSNRLDDETLDVINNMEKDELIRVTLSSSVFKNVCCICERKLNIFNTGIANRIKTGERLCLSCIRKLDNNTLIHLKKFSKEEILDKIAAEEVRRRAEANEKARKEAAEKLRLAQELEAKRKKANKNKEPEKVEHYVININITRKE